MEALMARAILPRIKHIVWLVILGATGVIAVELATTQKVHETRAATEWQLTQDVAGERVTCKKWGIQEGSEKFGVCLADLTEIRVKHDRRRASDPGNRRDGLMVVF
jgi:hypothetical protein